MNTETEQLDGLLGFLSDICPSRPEDTPNAPLLRRLHLLFLAARAIAAALPDNGGLGVAEAADLTVAAYGTADHVHAKANQRLPVATDLAWHPSPPLLTRLIRQALICRDRPPQGINLPAGYNMPTFTESATESQ